MPAQFSVLSSDRAWHPEKEGRPDNSKSWAVTAHSGQDFSPDQEWITVWADSHHSDETGRVNPTHLHSERSPLASPISLSNPEPMLLPAGVSSSNGGIGPACRHPQKPTPKLIWPYVFRSHLPISRGNKWHGMEMQADVGHRCLH